MDKFALLGDSSPATAEYLGVVPLYDFEKPAPMLWTVKNVIPEGYLTIMAADGGVGKSFIALYLAFCIASGRDFLGLTVKKSRVLYLDYELEAPDQMRRLHSICTGMGLTAYNAGLDGMLYHYKPDLSLNQDGGYDAIKMRIDALKVDVVVLDSLTFASSGADVNSAKDMNPILQRIGSLGVTVLALDHISKSSASSGETNSTPLGSVMKRNNARSILNLNQRNGVFTISSSKSNFGRRHDHISYRMDFDEENDTLNFRVVGSAGELAVKRDTTYDRTLSAIVELFKGTGAPVHVDHIVKWRHDRDGIALKGMRNHFSALKGTDKIIQVAEGYYIPTEHACTTHDALENSNVHASYQEHGRASMFTPGEWSAYRELS